MADADLPDFRFHGNGNAFFLPYYNKDENAIR
jgi:hypothetical protein